MQLPIVSILILIGVVLLVSIRQINEYQRGVLFTLGKYTKILKPGWRIVIPVLQSMVKVDLRVRTVDVPNQESLTKDNIPVGVNAVLYFRVKDPNKAIINVENFYYATSQLAQTTMRNAVGEVVLDKLLSDRDQISEGIRVVVDKMTDDWGIEIVNVELKDIIIPENMKRTIAKEAEAERERRAVIIKALGEVAAAENMAKAAKILGTAPGALHLRTLQSVNDLSSDQSNTTVWMMPVEMLKGFQGLIPKK
ncbi:slipin family protein [Candidatus Peregrinibacteria bacterium]|jgi:regulator of protease activity HflC (stomatin/prohibitin superfamily)|nr:slipin family protein [Candidatus Peregrinibacteria bacterium]MBT5823556.1 slipin family protein [Candidatus Peregrinibacteria bacterium]